MDYYNFECNDLWIFHTREEHPRPDDHSMHAHELYELYIFISGKGRYFVEGNEYQLIPGCILIMRPGETHHLKISPEHPYERIVAHFSGSILPQIDPDESLTAAWNRRSLGVCNMLGPGEYDQNLVRNCLSFTTEKRLKNSDPRLKRTEALCGLFPVLFEIYRCFISPEFPAAETPDPLINSVVRYINSNLTKDFTLGGLAEKFSLSKSYLNNRFKQITGSTIWRYTVIKRLILARQMIRGGASAMEAATSCGWGDYAAFYRRYKAEFGVSPSEDK